MCILSVYALLKVVGYYDLSVLSMSVMGFPKKKIWMDGGVSSIQYFFGFLDFFNFAKPLTVLLHCSKLLWPTKVCLVLAPCREVPFSRAYTHYR